jgi:hypothetical protein
MRHRGLAQAAGDHVHPAVLEEQDAPAAMARHGQLEDRTARVGARRALSGGWAKLTPATGASGRRTRSRGRIVIFGDRVRASAFQKGGMGHAGSPTHVLATCAVADPAPALTPRTASAIVQAMCITMLPFPVMSARR